MKLLVCTDAAAGGLALLLSGVAGAGLAGGGDVAVVEWDGGPLSGARHICAALSNKIP